MASKTRPAKKRKRKSGVMTSLAKSMVGLYGRVKQRLTRKRKAKQPGAKKPAAKPAAKPRARAAKRTRKAAKT
jgi:hypothetical protein